MKLRMAAISIVAVVAATPALASNLIDATDPAAILEVARGYGSAQLDRDSEGDPKITGRIDGTAYSVYFFGCTENKDCDDIRFVAAWNGRGKYSVQDMNTWNQEKRFGRAYLDSDDDPVFDMVVNIDYGVSRKNLDDSFNWWSIALKGFKKEVLGIE